MLSKYRSCVCSTHFAWFVWMLIKYRCYKVFNSSSLDWSQKNIFQLSVLLSRIILCPLLWNFIVSSFVSVSFTIMMTNSSISIAINLSSLAVDLLISKNTSKCKYNTMILKSLHRLKKHQLYERNRRFCNEYFYCTMLFFISIHSVHIFKLDTYFCYGSSTLCFFFWMLLLQLIFRFQNKPFKKKNQSNFNE